MKLQIMAFLLLFSMLIVSCAVNKQNKSASKSEKMFIRIAEIEIDSNYLAEYIAILKEESQASIKIEVGVISIYPMYQKENPNTIKILEIYKDKQAYEAHLQTPHFKHYKTTTLKMVKSLKLIEMQAIDEQTMPLIFQKLQK